MSSHWNTNGNSSGTARFSRQTLQDRIRDVMDIDLSGVDPNSWFTIQSANQYGWVAKIQVGPDAGVGTVSGRWFRENLLARQSVDGRSCAASASRSATTPIWTALSLMSTATATAAA